VTRDERFYVVVRNGLGAALVNALINGAFGWLITRGLREFPIWSVPGVAVDLVFTAFGITFGTCVVIPWQTRRDFQRGLIALPDLSVGVRDFIARFPNGLLRRALVLGALSVPVFMPPVLLGLFSIEAPQMERLQFIQLKTAFSAIQGGLVTPFIVLAILSDLSEGARGAAPALTEESR
jgi:hypothetical protein